MKIAILYSEISGYIISCIAAFQRQGNSSLIYAWPRQDNAPFDDSLLQKLGVVHDRSKFDEKAVLASVLDYAPDAVLVSGWMDKGYVSICRELRKRGILVVSGLDNQWRGDLRQRAAVLMSKFYLHKFIDVLWVSGEQQRQYANRLGYYGDHCWDGFYCCDWEGFSKYKAAYRKSEERYFLYAGRYVHEKGLDTLAEAYKRYQKECPEPWKLICAGRGPLQDLLLEAGAEDRGFMQPDKLPALMASASALILPSRYEPWGVVLQEAAACSLPLICSDACGAGVHLLRPYFNGYSFASGDVENLKHAMLGISMLDKESWCQYSENSFQLSRQYTPERWATVLSNGVIRVRNGG